MTPDAKGLNELRRIMRIPEVMGTRIEEGEYEGCLVASRHGDREVCERCKVKFLREMFDKAFSESDHDRWGDFLAGLGCERVAGLEEAKRSRDGRILIPCPGGLDFHILGPNECAESVLAERSTTHGLDFKCQPPPLEDNCDRVVWQTPDDTVGE